MNASFAVPKRIGRSIWKVLRTIGDVLYLILKLLVSPVLWLWRFVE